jgi:hypothetical protein
MKLLLHPWRSDAAVPECDESILAKLLRERHEITDSRPRVLLRAASKAREGSQAYFLGPYSSAMDGWRECQTIVGNNRG